MLQIKYYPGEGYNFLYMPDYRFYCDEKIQRHQSSYYDWPFKTRIWYPYKNLRLHYDYMPSRIPFREQRKMLSIKYDPVHGYDYAYDTPYIFDYRIHRPYDFYFDWPWRYRVWLPNRLYRRFLHNELTGMYNLQYDLQTPYLPPYTNLIDYEHVPYTKYHSVYIPKYDIYRPLDKYDKWPAWYHAYKHLPEFRYYLNNTLMRDVGKMLGLQYDPYYRYESWPSSKHVPIDIPDYKINRPLDYYGKWPEYYQILLPVPEFRTYLNNLLRRDLRLRQYQYTHTYW